MILLLPLLPMAVLLVVLAVAMAQDRNGLRSGLAGELVRTGEMHLTMVRASNKTPRGQQ